MDLRSHPPFGPYGLPRRVCDCQNLAPNRVKGKGPPRAPGPEPLGQARVDVGGRHVREGEASGGGAGEVVGGVGGRVSVRGEGGVGHNKANCATGGMP